MNILTVDRTEIHGGKFGIESFHLDGRAGGRTDVGKTVRQVELIRCDWSFRSAPEFSQVVV